MKYITIDRDNFLAGAASHAETTDGGFSPNSKNLNPSHTPGVMYGTGDDTALTPAPTGTINAVTYNPNVSGVSNILINETNKIYTLDGATFTNTATLATKTFPTSYCNIVSFNGFVVAPTAANEMDLIKLTVAGAITTETWWTGVGELNKPVLSNATADRPLIVFEKHLYIGDKERLHRVSTTNAVSEGILTLETFDNITALGIDPSSGKMLVAYQRQGWNANAARVADSYIGLYDGISGSLIRSVPVQGKVTAFFSVAGTTYVAYQNNIGYWTGAGIKFLRKLNATLGLTTVVSPSKFASSGNTLFYADGKNIIAFGEIIDGKPSFRNIKEGYSSVPIGCLFFADSNNLCYSQSGLLRKIDLTTKFINTYMESFRYFFETPADIKEVEVLYADAVPAGLSTATAVVYDDTTSYGIPVQNLTGQSQYLLTAPYRGKLTNSVKISLSQSGGAYGWRRIRIGYIPAGQK